MTRKGWLLFIAISIIWGIPYLFIKIAVRELDPSVIVFVRVAIAAIFLLPVAAQRGALRQVRGRWLAIGLLALMQIVGPFLLVTYGEQRIASSLTSLLIAADPLLVALLALRFDPRERVGGFRLFGLLLGMVGLVTLLGFDTSGNGQQLLGAALVLLAATGYAICVLLIRRPTYAALPSLGIVSVECAIATVVLFPLAVTHLPARMPDVGVLVSLVILGLVCTALAYLTFYALVAEVGASRGTVFTYVNPAVSVGLGVLLLGEPFNVTIALGFLLILLGSWFSTGGTLPFKRKPQPLPQQVSRDVEAIK